MQKETWETQHMQMSETNTTKTNRNCKHANSERQLGKEERSRAPTGETTETLDQDMPPAASVSASAFYWVCIMYISYLNTTTKNVLVVGYIEERIFK